MTGTRLHGYLIDVSEAVGDDAAGPSPYHDSSSPALRVRRGPDRPVPAGTAPEEVASLLAVEDRSGRYTFFLDPDGNLRLRFADVAEFVADARLERATAHLVPGIDPGFVDVLVHGMLISVRLLLDGHLVLHASSVAVNGHALAFCGASGMGKSTMAALGVVAGHALVTDDVLRVDQDGVGPPRVWPGARTLRLRQAARELAVVAHGRDRTGRTADDRIPLHPPLTTSDPVPLSAVIVPYPVRGLTSIQLQRLDPFDALRTLAAFPRITGWCEPSSSSAQFHGVADLCQRVPVVLARLPWGPPFDPGLFTELVGRLDHAPSGATTSPGSRGTG